MATTNLQLLTDSFQKIGVVDETQSPTPAQANNALRILNGFLLSQAADGMRLGWYTQTNLAANAPLRDADVYDVTILLASQLASAYGIDIEDNTLLAAIANATTRLTKRSIFRVESDLSELPRGQGGPWSGPGYW